VLVRVDFNVPLDEKTGAIMDDTRIQVSMPTIKYLIERGSRIVLCTHLGQPMGQVNEKFRVTPVARHLSQLIGKKVKVMCDFLGPM
jgi:phosphoglycerate kinase